MNEILKEEIDIIEEEKSNIVPFIRKATGGDEPPFEDKPNWLKDQGPGACFLVRERNNNSNEIVLEWIVQGITPRKGMYCLLTRPNTELIVDPARFSRRWELVEVLQTAEEFQHLQKVRRELEAKEEKEEKTDG